MSERRVRGAASAAAVGVLALSGAAQGQQASERASVSLNNVLPSVGPVLSWTFGPGGGFGVGVEAGVAAALRGCGSLQAVGAGVSGRAEWVSWDHARLTAYGHTGVGLGVSGISIEGGWSWSGAREGIPAGGAPSYGGVALFGPLYIGLRGSFDASNDTRPGERSIELGFRYPGLYTDSYCVAIEGRALRLGEGMILPAVLAGPCGWDLDPATSLRGRLAAEWLRAARTELASVPAFLRLAAELSAVGGPGALIEGARRAAREEVAHAAFCLERVAALLGRPVGLAPLSARPRAFASRAQALQTLAVEALEDGVGAEGAASAAAARVAEGAKLELRSSLRRLAREESGHADLSAHILDFCLREGGGALRGEIEQRRSERRRRAETAAPEPEDPREWTRQGLGSRQLKQEASLGR